MSVCVSVCVCLSVCVCVCVCVSLCVPPAALIVCPHAEHIELCLAAVGHLMSLMFSRSVTLSRNGSKSPKQATYEGQSRRRSARNNIQKTKLRLREALQTISVRMLMRSAAGNVTVSRALETQLMTHY